MTLVVDMYRRLVGDEPPRPLLSGERLITLRNERGFFLRLREDPQWELVGDEPGTYPRSPEFKDTEILEPGTEVDRFGSESGALVFKAGTPFPERAQEAEAATGPYHAYRLERPLRVLPMRAFSGWETVRAGDPAPDGTVYTSDRRGIRTDPPGGGLGYYLPEPIDDLLASGALTEITGSETQ
jgi:hypothetical protein